MPDSNAIPRTPRPAAKPGWKLRLEDRLGLLDRIEVLGFRTCGTPGLLRVRGRVRERRNVESVAEPASVWRNVLNTLRRLDSDEIPGATVEASVNGTSSRTLTDDEGYFSFELTMDPPLDAGWHDVQLDLVDSVGEPAEHDASASVLVPPPDAEFAIISDVDDTIIRTHSTDLMRQLEIILSGGAHDRVAFPGVPALYNALVRGPDDNGSNPVFYVSKSGWNLHDLLEEFMRLNDIPAGPMFLTDLHIFEGSSEVVGSSRHKWQAIDLLMRTYPEYRFVLIGDSGMHDPELYHEVVDRHPDRVRAIYIHDVSDGGRDEEIDRIAAELDGKGVPMIRMQDVGAAAAHACDEGLISRHGLEEVRTALRNDGSD